MKNNNDKSKKMDLTKLKSPKSFRNIFSLIRRALFMGLVGFGFLFFLAFGRSDEANANIGSLGSTEAMAAVTGFCFDCFLRKNVYVQSPWDKETHPRDVQMAGSIPNPETGGATGDH